MRFSQNLESTALWDKTFAIPHTPTTPAWAFTHQFLGLHFEAMAKLDFTSQVEIFQLATGRINHSKCIGLAVAVKEE